MAIAYLALPLASWLLTLVKASLRTLVREEHADGVGSGVTPPLLFLLPAHDEAKVIGKCIRSLLDQDYPESASSVVVIADNCQDETGTVARELGVTCLVRTDPEHPGKPRAIAWALGELGDLTRWDACVIVDADSEVPPDFATRLSGHGPLPNRLFQPYNTISNPRGSWLTRLAVLLGRARYEVDYPLRQRAGLNCPLTGNGMSVGTELLARDGWRAFSLTENWEVYADYTARGAKIVLANDARIYSIETESMAASRTRRSRWARGRAQVLKQYGFKILGSKHIGWHQKLDILADLSALPPTIHAMASSVLGVGVFIGFDGAMGRWYGWSALATMLPLASSSAIALAKDPEPFKTVAALLALPFYALWRSWLLLHSLFVQRESVWRKTER